MAALMVMFIKLLFMENTLSVCREVIGGRIVSAQRDHPSQIKAQSALIISMFVNL